MTDQGTAVCQDCGSDGAQEYRILGLLCDGCYAEEIAEAKFRAADYEGWSRL